VQAIDEILRIGVEVGTISRVASELFYSKAYLMALTADMRTRFGERGFSAAEFRDAYQTSRKYVIPLLEHFDVEGVTMRTGDLRHLKGQSS
jgi:selenocysteine-specific elongation factor